MGEFELIRQYFQGLGPMAAGDVGVGDDGAVLSIPAGFSLVTSIDTQLADVHFPADAPAEFIARRALRCALSDLAAMGASAHSFTLALTLPAADPVWLQAFSRGLREDADAFHCPLVGGDTTRGPLSITVQVLGLVAQGKAMLRSAARPGDRVYVSGTLGDAAAGLSLLDPNNKADIEDSKHLLDRYFFPQPRFALGRALSPRASACIDISDGLLADLGHICRCSGVGARIDVDALPVSGQLLRFAGEQCRELALSGGDDYELCFTVPADQETALAALSEELGLKLTAIGEIRDGELVECYLGGALFKPVDAGYTHF